MGIRKAELRDMKGITRLLDQLDYPGSEKFLAEKLERMIDDPDEMLLVFEAGEVGEMGVGDPREIAETGEHSVTDHKILAFISLHFIPQLALKGDFARISYFSVDEAARSQGIGRLLEEHCTGLAKQRGCDRMEVHCHERRVAAQNFYSRQGFTESPRYLVKSLRQA